MTDRKHPIQPLVEDSKGVVRFKKNQIVSDLLDFAQERGFGLHEIARGKYEREDREQFAQLIGYSHSGAGDLGYVSDEVWQAALAMQDGSTELEARNAYLRERLKTIQDGMRNTIAELYGVHPDDLRGNP